MQFLFAGQDALSRVPPTLADKPDVVFGDTYFTSRLLFRKPSGPKKYNVFGLGCPLDSSLVLNYQVEYVLLDWREFNR